MKRILLIIMVLIFYGSTYPWEFHAQRAEGNPLWILLHSWPDTEWNRWVLRDVGINVLLYVPLGYFAALAFPRWRWLAPVGLGLLLSSSIEMLQQFDARRVCSALDVLTNVAGAAGGAAAAWLIPVEISLPSDAAGATVLLGCWVVYQTFPMMPDLSQAHATQKLTHLDWSMPTFLTYTAEWLAVARLLEAVNEWLLPAALAAAPMKLLIITRTVTLSELCGAPAAMAIWKGLLRRSAKRDFVLGIILVTSTVLGGLLPLTFHPNRAAFSWIPFRALFLSRWESGIVILLHKSFLYGTAVWLWWQAGFRLSRAAFSVAAVLAVIEAAQMYLPGRAAESTDPLLALLMAAVLGLLVRKESASARG